MTEYQQQIKKMVAEANRLGNCSTKVNLLESAIQIADSHGDITEGFSLRTELISAATFSGYGEKALVAFSWCLAKYDQDPQKFPEFQLFWRLNGFVKGCQDFLKFQESKFKLP
jgi:hypothetical protein